MLQVSQLFIYPIKSLGGIELTEAEVTDRGLKYDRRWLLVDENNRFLSQREHAQMALFKLQLTEDGLQVTYKNEMLLVPFHPQTTDIETVTIWDDSCRATRVSDEADEWFTKHLTIRCRLFYMPDDSHRRVDERYARYDEITSFSDAYPFLLIGQASLDDLNKRLGDELPMDRFRPNIVFTGGEPYQEDELKAFEINGISFFGVKLCARCVMTTIDQQTAAKGAEPLKILSNYRRHNNKIMFGQNLLHSGGGLIRKGDEIKITRKS
ncbi:MOSC domain-containing protein [Mucilaginibacter sp. RS28]|uniref:MOSC domain-containing protein n=1 Tax=Mucilaginibacter straminoryzae TaxID=2932774 RepID=A0A9X1X4B6_9SPHI|nr:MOSC N-terminal beta barrel domain-containing protein [Mucilaginibacter straminoryzae]MCJ8208294.1 MOSC domain-containing protein [Mucilaginibacter straminoryzae]